jgi:hypothetical protein
MPGMGWLRPCSCNANATLRRTREPSSLLGYEWGSSSAFIQLLVRTGQLDEETGRLLRSLFERRNEADYAPVDVPVGEAEAAIRDAERVVRAVETWLIQHQ